MDTPYFNRESPKAWLAEIEDARLEHHTRERKERRFLASQLYRTGSTDPDFRLPVIQEQLKGLESVGSLKINVIYGILEGLVAMLLPADVKASVLPRRPGDDERAFNTQLWLNYTVSEAEIDHAIELALWRTGIYGDGFLKHGFTSIQKEEPESGEQDVFSGLPDGSLQELGMPPDEGEAIFRGDSPWVQLVDESNIIPAPGARSLGDTPYLIHKVRRRTEHVLDDVNYEEKARNSMMPALESIHEDPENPYSDTELLSDKNDEGQGLSRWCDVYEVYDWYNREYRVIPAQNPDIFLYSGPWFPGLEGYPFSHLKLKTDPEAFFGIPIINDLADLQEELNTVSTFMLESFRRTVPMILADKGRIGPEEKDNLTRADLAEIVDIEGDPHSALAMFPPPGQMFSPDIYGVRNMIIQAMMLVTGMSDFMMGQSQKTKSATEAAATVQGFTSRMRYKGKVVRRFIRDVLRKTYQISRWRMSGDHFIRLVGTSGAEMATVTPQDVQAELDVDIDAEIYDDRLTDPVRQKLVIDAMSPFFNSPELVQLGGVNIVELLRRYLRAIGERDTDKILPNASKPKDPEIENRAMIEGLDVETHPMDDDATHLAAHAQAQAEAPPERHIYFEKHMKKHTEMLQLKMQLAEQAQNAPFGGNGRGANQGGGIEAPSRRTSPNAGEQAARTQQVSNQ